MNDPRYIVFTWDSDNSDLPGDKKREYHEVINPHQYHEFEILVLPYNDTYTKYIIWWDGKVIRHGYNVIDTTGQVDQVHEAFAESESSFSHCSNSYFKESVLYTPNYCTNWGSNILTGFYAMNPVREDHWLEWIGGLDYWKFKTWID